MLCPSCHTETLKPARTKDKKFTLDSCTSCKGVWFDNGELSGTLKRSRCEEEVPQFGLAGDNTICPKCRVPLSEFPYPDTKIMVDGCAQCQGVWLDRDEWKRIRKSFQEPEQAEAKSNHEFRCPKCDTPQQEQASCIRCGIYFDKYYARHAKNHVNESEPVSAERTLSFDDVFSYKIEQELEWIEILTPFEKKNRYSVVLYGKKNSFGHVYEHSNSIFNFLIRQFLDGMRPANLLFKDEDDNLILKMNKRFRLYFHQIDLSKKDNSLIGKIKRRFHLLRVNYDIEDNTGQTIMTIRGPLFFLPFMGQTFRIFKQEEEVGTITKEWRGFLRESYTDADLFQTNFDPRLSTKEKQLLFGAVFLIDFVSYESNHDD